MNAITDKIAGLRGAIWIAAAALCAGAALISAPAALAAPAWLAPANLSAPGREASNSSVAMDEAGETVAVWERQSETGVDSDVQAATRAPGGSFSEPIRLSAAATEPDVAITPSGEAIVVWRYFEVSSGEYVIQASTRQPSGAFSAPLEISRSPAAALPQDLRVVINAKGEAAVVWIQQNPSSGLKENPSFVDASIRAPGAGFSAPETLSPLPLVSGQSADRPRVGIDAAGDVRAVWEYFDGTDDLIETASRAPGGGFSAPKPLSVDGEDAFGPDLAVDSSGATTVVWDQDKESNFTVRGAGAGAGAELGSPVNLSTASTSSLGEPVITTAPGGAAAVAWTQPDGGDNLIQAATGTTGGVFASQQAISPSGEEGLDPEVSEDASGAATIVWKGSDGTNDIVEAATGSAAGSFSAAVELSAAGQDAVFPRVAMDAAGDATAVWWRSDGSNAIVQAAGYDADAPTLSGVSVPSSGTVGVPVSFSVKPFDVWPIASTSFGFGDGAHAEGSSVSHTYAAPGTYPVTITARDGAGSVVSASAAITILPSNEFTIGRLKLNRKTGTAALSVIVPGPGRLDLSGRGVRKERIRPKRAGKVRILIRARGSAHKRLIKRGRVRLALSLAFTPSGGDTAIQHKRVTLVKKRR